MELPNWRHSLKLCVMTLKLVQIPLEIAAEVSRSGVRRSAVNKTVFFINPPSTRHRDMTAYVRPKLGLRQVYIQGSGAPVDGGAGTRTKVPYVALAQRVKYKSLMFSDGA